MTQRTPISKLLPKHFAKEKFRQACEQAYPWMMKAKEMRRSADLIWEQFCKEVTTYALGGEDTGEPFAGSVAMMLYAFTLENLLKAGLVHAGAGANLDGKFTLKSHRLDEMASSLNLAFSPAERELIERLEHFLTWAGRYPIPLTADGLYPRAMLDGSHGALYGFSTGEQEHISALLNKVYAALPTEEDAIVLYAKSNIL